MAAPYAAAPPVVVMAPAPTINSCKCCGGGPVIWERDQCCYVTVILVAIFCFPCGLFALCCMPQNRPKCLQCGAGG